MVCLELSETSVPWENVRKVSMEFYAHSMPQPVWTSHLDGVSAFLGFQGFLDRIIRQKVHFPYVFKLPMFHQKKKGKEMSYCDGLHTLAALHGPSMGRDIN